MLLLSCDRGAHTLLTAVNTLHHSIQTSVKSRCTSLSNTHSLVYFISISFYSFVY